MVQGATIENTKYFLQGGYLWTHLKKRTRTPLGVVSKGEQMILMSEFHQIPRSEVYVGNF